MEEVYETRFEELDKWISEKKKQVADCKEELERSQKKRPKGESIYKSR